MPRNNKPAPGVRGTGWARLLALLVAGLALVATSCKDTVGEIGVGLPNAQVNTGAYLIDTLTIRASTVQRDSVITSNSSYLLVGRTVDPILGTLRAQSAFRLGLGGSFTPDASTVFDSLVLVLNPDTYRYGDTTQVQDLVQVHRLTDQLPLAKPIYASTALTNLPISPVVLNARRGSPVNNPIIEVPRARVRANANPIRLYLDPRLGKQLLDAGKAGNLATQDQLDTFLPGLAIQSADNDKGALLRLSATGATTGLYIYYHDPTDAATPIIKFLDLATGNRHGFQVTADRTGTILQNRFNARLTPVDASLTSNQTFVEGALGLQTKLEFPYLRDLFVYGANITLTSAQLSVSVPTTSLSPYVPAPPALNISTSNGVNQPTGTYLAGVSYLTAVSPLTGLDQGTYEWSIMSYVQAVLSNSVPNNGLLLSAVNPELPNRVVLGGPRNALNKPKLRLYFIQLN